MSQLTRSWLIHCGEQIELMIEPLVDIRLAEGSMEVSQIRNTPTLHDATMHAVDA